MIETIDILTVPSVPRMVPTRVSRMCNLKFLSLSLFLAQYWNFNFFSHVCSA